MATAKKTAPSVLDALKNLKKGKILPLYYFFGEDAFSLNLMVRTIEDTVAPNITSDFDKYIAYGEDCDLENILNMAQTFPFGSGKKLIIVKEAEKLKDIKAIEEYLNTLPEFSILVFMQNGKITNVASPPFNQLLEKGFLFEAREMKGEVLVEWIMESVESRGKKITYENASFLANISGEDRFIIDSQIEKIINYLGSQAEISFKIINEVSTSFKKYNIFDLQNSVFKKDKAAAVQIAITMLEKGEDAGFIINMLTRAIIGLSQLKELNQKKVPETEMARTIGTHQFYLKDYQRASVLFTERDLQKAVEALLKADVSLKTTSIDHKTLILILIAELF